MESDDKQIYVKMFSEFEITMGTVTLTDESIRSNMLVKLLAYLICNRRTVMNTNDLCDILWSEGESDNPLGALKNLTYRLRTILKKSFGTNDMIKTLRGAYAWNTEYPITIDAEEFEQLYHRGRDERDIRQQIHLYEQALALYTGDFMMKFPTEHWILQQTAYYHSLYISCVKALAELYEEEKEYEKMEILCINALKHEELDETIHCLLLRAYIHLRKKAKAEEHYKATSELLYSQLGTVPSKEMQDLYQEILKEMQSEQKDLSLIQKDLVKEYSKQGAYYCEYGIFKEIYTLQQRQAKRVGIAVHCGLLTVESTLHLPLNSDAYKRFRDHTMELLRDVIKKSLRSGDVYARYSATQYVIMLPTCNYEGGLIALERIEDKFYDQAEKYHAKLLWDLKEMDLK